MAVSHLYLSRKQIPPDGTLRISGWRLDSKLSALPGRREGSLNRSINANKGKELMNDSAVSFAPWRYSRDSRICSQRWPLNIRLEREYAENITLTMAKNR